MLKSWKSLFVKTDESEPGPNSSAKQSEPLSFPVSSNSPGTGASAASEAFTAQSITDPAVNEVMQVYENGLDSINMPGYDFYEFYKAISSIGVAGEQTYTMAFQMARSMDKTITPQKLLADAEFYISKIGEVHGQYVTQGKSKLNALQEEKSAEKSKLMTEIDQSSIRLAHLKVELQELEATIAKKKIVLNQIDEHLLPKEKAIRDKLNANDMARKNSIDKLNMIREGIQRFIK